MPPDLLQRVTARIPLQRFGSVYDISSACVFLCSSAAAYVTGTTLVVDGGAWMTTAGFVAGEMKEMQARTTAGGHGHRAVLKAQL